MKYLILFMAGFVHVSAWGFTNFPNGTYASTGNWAKNDGTSGTSTVKFVNADLSQTLQINSSDGLTANISNVITAADFFDVIDTLTNTKRGTGSCLQNHCQLSIVAGPVSKAFFVTLNADSTISLFINISNGQSRRSAAVTLTVQ